MKLNRRDLRNMILKEQEHKMKYNLKSADIKRQLAAKELKKVLSDLQNIPDQNFDRYIQYLINYKLPTIIQNLEF